MTLLWCPPLFHRVFNCPCHSKVKQSLCYLLHQRYLLTQSDTMVSAALLLVLCILPSLAHAYCFMSKAPELVHACRDGKLLHEVGTTWRTKDCMDCTCSATGMSCCSVGPSSISFPEDCMEVYDKANCHRYAVKKNDKSIKCMITGAVGK
ncbi:beta-microseminoprotein-like [Clupea harengus]|uniref:Beta-microseminoprotein-like n=1 Tax=Clupea harengus TaxID=7950 RepID=A0A6P8EPM1_CLUHA|nr:beta-microseminoprotein-like [Clupea harengus]